MTSVAVFNEHAGDLVAGQLRDLVSAAWKAAVLSASFELFRLPLVLCLKDFLLSPRWLFAVKLRFHAFSPSALRWLISSGVRHTGRR